MVWEHQEKEDHIHYSGRNEKGWSAPLEPAPGNQSSSPLLGADGVGGLHLLYGGSLISGGSPPNSYISRSPDGTWSAPEETPDAFAFKTMNNQMVVDPAGGVHIVYYDKNLRALLYSYRPPAGPFTAPETLSTEGDHAVLAKDASDTIYLAQLQSNQVKLRRHESSGWSTPEIIPTDAKAGDFFVTPDGAWHLLFREADGSIRHLGDPAHGWPAKGTLVESPQTGGPVVEFEAFVSDSEGGLHAIWYSGRPTKDGDDGHFHVSLTHAHLGSGWSDLEELYITRDNGSHPVVAAGPDGCIHLARREERQVHYMEICR